MNQFIASLRLTLLNAGHVMLDKKWNYDNVISPFTRLYYIKKGTARVYHHGRMFTLKAGHLYLVPSYTYSRYRCESSMEQYYVHFLEEAGPGVSVYNLKTFLYERKAMPMDKLLFERLLRLNPGRKLVQDDPRSYDNRQSLVQFEQINNNLPAHDLVETKGILYMLFARFMSEQKPQEAIDPKTVKITDTLYYISEHLDKTMTVAQLANRCHTNADYFSRLFKEQTGMRPLIYLQTKRVERAQLLLATTNHSMQEIADMVGLGNISYFSRLFTRITKKTPGMFRKEQWNV